MARSLSWSPGCSATSAPATRFEKAVFDQLTAARQTKARQVETYFRTIKAELRLLATSKMVVDATREFRIAVDELDRAGTPPELRQKVSDWYAENFMPDMTRVLGKKPALADYLPVGALPTISSTTTSSPIRIRRSGASCSTMPATAATYSRLHAIYHPLMRAAATTVGFFDFMLADPKSGRLIYTVEKEVDFATSLQFGPYRRSNVAAAVARCARHARPVGHLPGGFRRLRAVAAARRPPSWQRR